MEGEENILDIEEREGVADEDFYAVPLSRLPHHRLDRRLRRGGRENERIEARRASARERARQLKANETQEQRASRRASNLASVSARRSRIRLAADEEMQALQDEARRRATAAGGGGGTASEEEDDEAEYQEDNCRLLFYRLTLPAEGPIYL